jgi:solute carrier family 30 (zinc transporter), member 9
VSSSVTVSIATNTAITAAKGFGWFVTGSPTLFAETVHSIADVANQVLLKIGEVRGREGPDIEHPFGHGQEKYFWALVSAVSVFFIGCGINLYHGIHSLLSPTEVQPFTPLVIGLLLFALALELYTFFVALKEIGGLAHVHKNLNNTTVLAVLLEDFVAVLGILLTLLVAGAGYFFGPHPGFDAAVAIIVALLLGGMAGFLAHINRSILIDSSDIDLDRAAERWLAERSLAAKVHSLVLDNDRAVAFVTLPDDNIADTHTLGVHLQQRARTELGKTIDDVYWRFGAR